MWMFLKSCSYLPHSDLALRTAISHTDLTAKVGDYGIGPSSFKVTLQKARSDRFWYNFLLQQYCFFVLPRRITSPQRMTQCVALRWLAPELIGELHGGVITSEQTNPSNVWYVTQNHNYPMFSWVTGWNFEVFWIEKKLCKRKESSNVLLKIRFLWKWAPAALVWMQGHKFKGVI